MWILSTGRLLILVKILEFQFSYCEVRDLTSATLEGDKVELGQ